METSTKTIRNLASVVGVTLLAIASFPFAAPAEDSAQGRLSGAELQALKIRSQALNCLYGRGETCLTPAERRALEVRSAALNRYGGSETRMTAAELRALRARSRALNWRYDRAATRVRQPAQSTSSASSGADWAAVSIGAGGAVGLLLVGAAALLMLRRRQARFA